MNKTLQQSLALLNRRRELEACDRSVLRVEADLAIAAGDTGPKPEPVRVDDALAEVRRDKNRIELDARICQDLAAIREGRLKRP